MRIPKPFFRKQTKSWYVQIGKKQHNLGPDEDAAKEKYGRLIAGRQPIDDETTVVTILFLFLAWCKDNRAASTHEQYAHYIHSFGKFIGDTLRVEKLTPEHVYEWVDSCYQDHSDNTRRNAMRGVQRVFNWAVKTKKLKHSPMEGLEKPAYVPRDAIIEPEQWQELIAALEARRDSGRALLDLVTVIRQTGCRPLEARTAEARHLDRKDRCLIFERAKSKGYGRGKKTIVERRVVPLTDEVFALCEKQALKYPDGPLFRNSKGRPWTSHAIHRWCDRLDQQNYETPSSMRISFRLRVYAIRHTWATEALERGVDPVTVATILGHKDMNMLLKVYAHLEKKKPYLRKAMLQATGQAPMPSVAVPA